MVKDGFCWFNPIAYLSMAAFPFPGVAAKAFWI
jgi:hypothetical protein